MQISKDRSIPMNDSFWTSPGLDELAREQSAVPVQDIHALFGTWPGKPDDGFEELIDDLRNQGAQHHVE
jgi:hypothetical protein